MADTNETNDLLAAMMAGVGAPPRHEMQPVPPPVLPERNLPAGTDPTVAIPPPHEKLDSAEKLATRVAALRDHYAPYLRDLTPPSPQPRPRLPLDRFVFRFETDEDRRNPQRPYGDSDTWEAVTVPHYRGPAGPWAAYYRTTFKVDNAMREPGHVWLRFCAVDYIAEVFVNGIFVGRHEGLFAPFGFDITPMLKPEGDQVLLVRVLNDWPQGGGKKGVDGSKVYAGTGQGWDSPEGWTHCPPGAGIWQPVCLEGCPTTAVHDIFVRPLPEQHKAELWLETYRNDISTAPVSASLTLYPNNFEGAPLELGEHDLDPAGPGISLYKLPIDLPDFRWWRLETPHLYTLRVQLLSRESTGNTEDICDAVFGMRSFTQDTAGDPKGSFYLNGEEIILRGTNEMGNLSVPIQQGNPEQTITDLLISKAAHMNYWRITQRPVQPEVYDLCNRLGVLFQTDLPLFGTVRQSCMEETARQAGEMERLVRSHPAAVVSSFINESIPESWTRDHKRVHRVLDREGLEAFFEVCINYTHLYNPDRVIKCADGDYSPPPRHGMLDVHAYVCMHEDHGTEVGKLHRGELFDVKQGWRCGVGEYGAEGMEPLATMRKHYPVEWLPEDDNDPSWTPNRIPMCQAWNWHHQWYDRQDTLPDWIAATHHHQAWAVRFMHEGYRRRMDIINSTTLHLLVNAWPNNWLKSLCSFEREPLPGYFAYVDANTPLAVNLRTDRHAVTGGDALDVALWILNDLPEALEGMEIVYRISRGDETLLVNRCAAAVSPVSSTFQGRLQWQTPAVDTPTPLDIHAALLDAAGEVRHDYSLRLTLYPRVDWKLLATARVAIIGNRGERAWQLAEAFGADPVPWDKAATDIDLVIIDDAEATSQAGAALGRYVEAGGAVLGLSQPLGAVWHIGEHTVEVRQANGHQFVSRKTGHPVVDGLDPFYFSLWYDAAQDRIAHLSEDGLQGEDLRPITLTGVGIWGRPREEFPAGAEKQIGSGRVILDQVRAAERLHGEPRAAVYLERLLAYALQRH